MKAVSEMGGDGQRDRPNARRRPARSRALAILALALTPTPTIPAVAQAGPGAWVNPVAISATDTGPRFPQVAVNEGGDAIAVWDMNTGYPWYSFVQVAFRRAGGTWTPPMSLTEGLSQDPEHYEGTFYEPHVAINRHGEAVAVWERYDYLGGLSFPGQIQAAVRDRNGDWSGPETLSPDPGMSYSDADDPRPAIDADGNATAVWDRWDGHRYVAEYAVKPAAGVWTPAGQLPCPFSCDVTNWAYAPRLSVSDRGETLAVWEFQVGARVHIVASGREPGGQWSSPAKLSEESSTNQALQLAANDDGRAVAAWEQIDSSGQKKNSIRAATRQPGGGWSAPATLSNPGRSAEDPQVAIDRSGWALAVWEEPAGDGTTMIVSATQAAGDQGWRSAVPVSTAAVGRCRVYDSPYHDAHTAVAATTVAVVVWRDCAASGEDVYAATGPIGGAWTAPARIAAVTHSQWTEWPLWPLSPRVAADAEGNAVAVWEQETDTAATIEARAYDAAGPRLDGLSIPATGTAGEPLAFAVSPFDAWSAATNVSWDFGDGSGATGGAVGHSFADPGDYSVRVTAIDENGNSTTRMHTVSVIAVPPLPSPPPNEPPAAATPQSTSPGNGTAALGRDQVPPVLIFDASVSVAGRAVAPVRIRCNADLAPGCAGTLSLRTARPVKIGRSGRRRAVTIGRSGFSIAAGESGTVRVRLSEAGRRLLARLKKLRVKVVVGVPGATQETVARTITLRARQAQQR